MDLNALLGNGEGSWNYNARKGAEERDRERQAKAALVEIIARAEEAKQRQRHSELKLPGELERQSLDNILARVQGQQGQHNLDIGRKFDAPMKEATLAGQQATNAKTGAEAARMQGENFLNDVAAAVAANGSASPQQIIAAAKKQGLDENHVLVQMLLRTDPAKQAQVLPKAQLSSTPHRQKLDELRVQGDNSARVAGINAAGGIRQAQIGADAQNDPAKMSTDQALARAFNEIRVLKAQIEASRNPREVDNLQTKLMQWMAHADQLQKAKQEQAIAPVRERAAQQDAQMAAILRAAGVGNPTSAGVASPTQGPAPNQARIVDFNSLP